MGFFSWNCPECGHSIMSPYDLKDTSLNDCTLVNAEGAVLYKGHYDGYGRICTMDPEEDEFEINWKKPVRLYHTKCWNSRKQPIDVSTDARGQGFFFDDGDPKGEES